MRFGYQNTETSNSDERCSAPCSNRPAIFKNLLVADSRTASMVNYNSPLADATIL
jgi:hypothetical protein